jgi:hypothetical protein
MRLIGKSTLVLVQMEPPSVTGRHTDVHRVIKQGAPAAKFTACYSS